MFPISPPPFGGARCRGRSSHSDRRSGSSWSAIAGERSGSSLGAGPVRYQIPAMLKTGARDCAIVNMASIYGMVAAIGMERTQRLSMAS